MNAVILRLKLWHENQKQHTHTTKHTYADTLTRTQKEQRRSEEEKKTHCVVFRWVGNFIIDVNRIFLCLCPNDVICTLHIIFMCNIVTKMNFSAYGLFVCLCLYSQKLNAFSVCEPRASLFSNAFCMRISLAVPNNIMKVNVYSSIVISVCTQLRDNVLVECAICLLLSYVSLARDTVNMCAKLVFSFDLFRRNHLMMNDH